MRDYDTAYERRSSYLSREHPSNYSYLLNEKRLFDNLIRYQEPFQQFCHSPDGNNAYW